MEALVLFFKQGIVALAPGAKLSGLIILKAMLLVGICVICIVPLAALCARFTFFWMQELNEDLHRSKKKRSHRKHARLRLV